MFTQKWRDYWGLKNDPFACEDADKDLLLEHIDLGAVHSGFDRLFGDPRSPSPGIVFGEKGSGKSGLRLMMRRRLAEHNRSAPDEKVFEVEYVDFNSFIDEVGHAVMNGRRRPAKAATVIGGWEISDHLDAILSLSVTKLVDEVVTGDQGAGASRPKLSTKQKLDLQILTALYYRSKNDTVTSALERVRKAVKARAPGGAGGTVQRVALTLLGLLIIASPHLAGNVAALDDFAFLGNHVLLLTIVGLLVAGVPWLVNALRRRMASRRAGGVAKSIRILPDDPEPLAQILHGLSAKERGEFILPEGTGDAQRYELLQRFLGLLEPFGYRGLYVLVDRVDEPTLLSDSDQWMREFVAKILDIKLLQHPRLALKLFLPIEMESLWHQASADQLKRMRLDKSNLIPELKWTGRELYEIANQRMSASLGSGGRAATLGDLFGDDLEMDYVLETLGTLATPRYAFGFLAEAFVQYVKDLPNDLDESDGAWKLPRAHFDVVRAGWIDKTGFLRRTLN